MGARGTWTRRRRRLALAGVALALCAAGQATAASLESPGETRINERRGRFVEIPNSIPHAEGAYIDKRIVRQLRWIADHFDVYIQEGFAGKLRNGERVGCPPCHVERSEHRIGLAVDIVPLDWDGQDRCAPEWRDVTRLARWAEPHGREPVPPFRWVGYEGDENHGCGDHLHLSWRHHPRYKRHKPSRWVEVFRTR